MSYVVPHKVTFLPFIVVTAYIYVAVPFSVVLAAFHATIDAH